MHHTMDRMMRPPTMITAITGHLQNVAFIQLSQLENAVLTSVILPWVSVTIFLLVKVSAIDRASASLTNSKAGGLKDLAIAISTDGMLR